MLLLLLLLLLLLMAALEVPVEEELEAGLLAPEVTKLAAAPASTIRLAPHPKVSMGAGEMVVMEMGARSKDTRAALEEA